LFKSINIRHVPLSSSLLLLSTCLHPHSHLIF
jgi:hypothetical protein